MIGITEYLVEKSLAWSTAYADQVRSTEVLRDNMPRLEDKNLALTRELERASEQVGLLEGYLKDQERHTMSLQAELQSKDETINALMSDQDDVIEDIESLILNASGINDVQALGQQLLEKEQANPRKKGSVRLSLGLALTKAIEKDRKIDDLEQD